MIECVHSYNADEWYNWGPVSLFRMKTGFKEMVKRVLLLIGACFLSLFFLFFVCVWFAPRVIFAV